MFTSNLVQEENDVRTNDPVWDERKAQVNIWWVLKWEKASCCWIQGGFEEGEGHMLSRKGHSITERKKEVSREESQHRVRHEGDQACSARAPGAAWVIRRTQTWPET